MEKRIRQFVVAGVKPRMLSRAAGAVGLAMLATVGCRDAMGPVDLQGLSIVAPASVHFTHRATGGYSYNAITVPVTITNSTARPVAPAYCGESLEQFRLPSWQSVWSPVCLAVLVSVPPIPPGESRTINVAVGDTPVSYSGFRFTDPENMYRVRFVLSVLDGDTGTAVPAELSVSNVFQVVP